MANSFRKAVLLVVLYAYVSGSTALAAQSSPSELLGLWQTLPDAEGLYTQMEIDRMGFTYHVLYDKAHKPECGPTVDFIFGTASFVKLGNTTYAARLVDKEHHKVIFNGRIFLSQDRAKLVVGEETFFASSGK